ncbi:MAG: hypothetical protein IK108_09205 [Clostridia bacterium]|nr:hypothetical protein [Clostridia bacterium]
MKQDELLAFLQKAVNEVIGENSIVLTPKTKLSGLSITSFAMIQLICYVEDHFDIEIPNSEIRSFRTVKNILDYLGKRVP